jgi:hypothetical protein
LLNADPVAAVVDTYAFIFQMKGYVNEPTMKTRFGVFLPVATDALNRMDGQMQQLVLTAAPSANIPDIRRRIGEWADAHPIRTGLAGRTSADLDLIRQVDKGDLGAMASIKALQEGLGDITARLDTYNNYLPKQARWQAELLLGDLAHDPEFNAAASNFTVLTKVLDKTSNDLDRMPDMAAKAREVALADVENQRLAAQSFFTQERAQVMDALARQRIAAMGELDGQRLAATGDLRTERQTVLDAIHEEEMAVMRDLQTVGQQTLNDFDKRAQRLVDYAFWRAIEILLIALVLFFLIAWALLRRFTSTTLPSRVRDGRAA